MATIELEIPETLLKSSQQAAQSAGLSWEDFVRQALVHEAESLKTARPSAQVLEDAYSRTKAKYANALAELAK